MKLDAAQLTESTRDVVARLRALRETVSKSGTGEVLVSRRSKTPGQKGRAMHGRACANFLRTQGHDPFGYPPAVLRAASDAVYQGVPRIMQAAWDTKTQQQAQVKGLFLRVAQGLADWARENLLAGGLGTVSTATEKRKATLARRGLINPRWVSVLGVRTQQFADGIRARWRAGRQRG